MVVETRHLIAEVACDLGISEGAPGRLESLGHGQPATVIAPGGSRASTANPRDENHSIYTNNSTLILKPAALWHDPHLG